MSEDKYTVTFRMAEWRDIYDNPDDDKEATKSSGGHLWYVLHKNGEEILSAGFHSKNEEISGEGEITPNDEKSYRNSPSRITIQISQQQYEELNKFGKPDGINAKAMGFDTSRYTVTAHNCVSYVLKALHLIGYNPKDINLGSRFSDLLAKYDIDSEDGTKLYEWFSAAPGWAMEDIIKLLAENGAIAVEGNKLIPVSELKNIKSNITDNQITGYDDNADEIHGGKGNDTLIGKSGNDRLYGGDGNDILYGNTQSSSVQSSFPSIKDSFPSIKDALPFTSAKNDENDDDILDGGKGNDILDGGEGHDIYYIGGKDTIIDSDGQGILSFLDKDFQPTESPETLANETWSDDSVRGGPLVYRSADGNVEIFSDGRYFYEQNYHKQELIVRDSVSGHSATIKEYKYTGYLGMDFYLPCAAEMLPLHLKENGFSITDYMKKYYDEDNPEVTPENIRPKHPPEMKIKEERLNIYRQNNKVTEVKLPQIRSTQTTYRMKGNDLLLTEKTSGNTYSLLGFYNSPHNQIQTFRFSDRTLSLEQMRKEGFTLSANSSGEIMYDWHKSSNTTFNGSDKDDKIYAGDGDDTLVGGKGNDLLQGGNGADKYVFKKGHGQDIITEFNTTKDEDSIQFNDVKFEEVKFRRDNYDLILFGYNEQDSVIIKAFFADQANQLENYQFSDRTFTLKEFKQAAIPFVGTEKDDQLYDWQNGEGSATFDGGEGNDILNGNTGADTYLFGKNHGDDIIKEGDVNGRQDIDIIKFTEIHHLDKLHFSRKGNHLRIQEINTDDSVTVNNWFAGKNYQVEQIQLADNSIITNAEVNRMIQAMSTFGAHSESTGGIIASAQNDPRNLPPLAPSV